MNILTIAGNLGREARRHVAGALIHPQPYHVLKRAIELHELQGV